MTTANAEAGSSKDPWHTTSIRVPFLTADHASVAKRVLGVDREQNAEFVMRELVTDDNVLVINYAATTVRLLRLATNSFLSSVDLVLQTMDEFAPDPSGKRLTDEELEQIRRDANAGAVKGIELKGDGKGAGSGEEVR